MLERVFVWAHVLIILGFLAYLPHSKHLHIATAAINVFFGRTRAGGRLEPLDFESEDEAAMRFGAGTVADLTWKQMLDAMSCTECGRCQDVCPAFATGKALSPKLLIMGIRDQLFAEGKAALAGGELSPLVPNAVTDDVVWDCVTCGACVQECPVSIEHVDHIVDLRRNLVMVESRLPGDTESMLRDVERGGESLGQAAGRASVLGGRPRSPRPRAGRPAPGVPLLGRLRGGVRRASALGGDLDDEADAGRRARRRDPRSSRVVHRRSGEASRERVRLPVVRAGRTSRRSTTRA